MKDRGGSLGTDFACISPGTSMGERLVLELMAVIWVCLYCALICLYLSQSRKERDCEGQTLFLGLVVSQDLYLLAV